MATFQEINNYYKTHYNKDFPRATLNRWVQNNIVIAEKQNNGRYNYDLNSFIQALERDVYKERIQAKKERPEDYIGKIRNKLFIKGIVPKEQRIDKKYKGTIMYCDCLNCGKQDIQVRFAYLTYNGNYTQETCGCNRKIRAFQAATRTDLTDEFLNSFENFSKFLCLHKTLSRVSNLNLLTMPIQEYKNYINHFYNDKQFNAIYNFCTKNKKK